MLSYSKFTPYKNNDPRQNLAPKVTTFEHAVLPTKMPPIEPLNSNFELLNQATNRSYYHTPLPCFVSPALNTIKYGKPQYVADTNSYQNPTGYARNLPRGTYSIPSRERLFNMPVNPLVTIKSDLTM